MNAVDVEVDRYLARVRDALADVPDEASDDLLEDLPAHFAEVLAEHGGSLEERLGPPEAYAAELRVAAGIETGDQRLSLRHEWPAASGRRAV